MTDGGRDDLDRLLRRAAGFADRDADERWQVVAELHSRTDRPAFDAACRLAGADSRSDRVLTDEEGDTAGEALLGLARRGDQRALAPLLAWLDGEPGNLIVEAVAELAAIEALPALLRLKHAGWQRDEPRPSVLDDAIRACSAGTNTGRHSDLV